MNRLYKLMSIWLLGAAIAAVGQVRVASAAPSNKPTEQEKLLEKDIQQEEKQIKKDIQQVHKDMVKPDEAYRLVADEATEANDRAELQVEENELSGLLGSASK